MDQFMKVGGEIICKMEEEDLSMLIVMSLMDNGKTTWRMDTERIIILMGPPTKGTGSMIKNMELDLKFGQMVTSMKDYTPKERNTVWENSLGQMEASIMASILITINMEWVSTLGLKVKNMKDLG